MTRRLVAVVSTVGLAGSLGFVAAHSPAGAATVTFDVSNDHVTCNTLSGSVKFATGLTGGGASTGANTITIKGAVAGCTDSDNSAIKMFKGAFAATLNTNNGTNCTSLLGTSAISGTA